MKKLFLSLMLLTGCASKEIILTQDDLIPHPEAAKRTSVATAHTFSVAGVDDLRKKEGNWVGTARTGASNTETPVSLEQPVSTVVKYQIEKELRARGMAVQKPADFNLVVKIQQLELSEEFEALRPEAAVCNAKMEIEASSPQSRQRLTWKGNAFFQAPGTFLDTTKLVAPTLAGCVNMIVEQLVTNDQFKTLISAPLKR